MSLIEAAQRLSKEVDALRFDAPVTHVYNPLAYAWKPHRRYLDMYGAGPREVLLLGMNPGPFGMAQTGVPFGEIAHVRDWLGIEAEVGTPKSEHPKRPIEGFACKRSEVSGARLWGWAKASFGSPDAFFARFFVANYCPLVFMEDSGKNRTPEKLPAIERDRLYAACDRALAATIASLCPKLVVGVGTFAEARLGQVCEGLDPKPKIGRILHPSPASPLANKGWAEQVTKELGGMGIRW